MATSSGPGIHGNAGLLPSVPRPETSYAAATTSRDRSGFTSRTGLRAETSYASTTASKVSITPVPLDALESILEDYNAGRVTVQSPPLMSAPSVAEGESRKGGAGTSSDQARRAAGEGRGHGRPSPGSSSAAGKPSGASGRIGLGAPGIPSKGPSLLAVSRAPLAASGAADQNNNDQTVEEQETDADSHSQQLPGLPPGSGINMSNRAMSVLMNPESAAHLRRVIPLEQGALENHYVIANPAGETLVDLEEVCDGTKSVEGLPLGRDAVVLLTTTPDGVPVPRVVTLDTGPGPNSLRRTGGLGGPRISASGSEWASPVASAEGMATMDGTMTAGPYDGSVPGSADGPGMLVPPLWSDHGGGAGLPAQVSLSGRPLPSPHRHSMVQQSPHHRHGVVTSTPVATEHTTLALPAVPAAVGTGLRRNTSGRMTASGSRVSASQLPQLPGRSSLLDSVGAGTSGADTEAPGSYRTNSASRSEPSTPRMWSAVSASARGGSGRQDRYRPSDLVIPGAGTSEERAVSPTRARLQGRINALMAQRYLEAAASGGTVLGAPAGGQKMMSNLSGMELVQVALKQVEHGEKGLADPWGRQVDSAGRPGSHGSQAAVDEVDLETEEEREARLEVERRQARLVRALTTLLVTGRERNPMPYMTLSVTDGLSQLPSAATSRMPSRNASIAWSRAASSRLQSAHAMVRSRRQSHAPEEDPGHLRLVSVTSSTHPVSLGDQVLGATSPHASDAGCPAPKTLQPSTLPNKPERHVRMRLGVGEPGHAASPSQRNSHVGDEGKKSAPHSPGRQPLAGDSQPALPHPPRRPKDAVGASSQPAATTQPQQSGPGQPRAPSVAGSEGARAPLPADLATVMRYHGDMLSRGTALTGIGAWEPPDPDVEESLEEAARVAEEGGLDFEELLEFVAHLDSVNQEFKLVDAARDRSRRVEAMLASAPGAAGGRGDSPRRGMAASGELPGAGVNTTVMHLLTKRRDGRVSNVTQLLNSYSAMAPSQATSSDSQPLQQQQPAQPSGLPSLPAGSPQLGAGGGAGGGVDLEALLGAISEALSTDLADMANQATRFDETFRLRTEQYLSALCRLNPAAFEETSAAQAEADYRSSVERAKLRLRQLHGEVEGDMLTSAGKPKNQYEKAVAMLQSNRPYFLPPMFTKERAQRAPVSPSAGEKAAPRPAWDVHASIFRERKKCDARDVVDTPSVLAKQFDLDWSRVVSKMLFMKLVAREDQGVRGKGGRLALEQELAEVRQELLAAFPLIRSAFVYFSISPTVDTYVAACERAAAVAIADGRSPEAAAAEVAEAAATATAVIMAGGAARSASPSRHELLRSDSSSPPPPPPPPVSESIATARAAVASLAAAKPAVPSAGYAFFEMDESHWLAFCCAVGVTSSNQAGVRVQDLRSLFWTVNKEEEKNLTLESVANSDYAYTRFEFMEALVRTAFARYIHGGMVTDGSDATKMLMQHLRGVLPPLALVDPNTFRREKLYTADMERAIVHNLELLTAAFKLFKARDKAKYMDISHWMSFVESNNLLAPHMGLTVTEARLVFAWSQTVVVDELKLRRRAVSLQLWDFIEAVARLADRIALPVTEEMDKWMLYNLNIGRNTPLPPGHTRVWTYCTALSRGKGPGLVRRASSSDLLAAATRPLAVKFRAFLDYLAGHMADQWGGSNTHETAQNMLRTASLLSGGVELA